MHTKSLSPEPTAQKCALYPQKSPVNPGKSPIYLQIRSTYAHKEPIISTQDESLSSEPTEFSQKSPLYPQKSPVNPGKSPIYLQIRSIISTQDKSLSVAIFPERDSATATW